MYSLKKTGVLTQQQLESNVFLVLKGRNVAYTRFTDLQYKRGLYLNSRMSRLQAIRELGTVLAQIDPDPYFRLKHAEGFRTRDLIFGSEEELQTRLEWELDCLPNQQCSLFSDMYASLYELRKIIGAEKAVRSRDSQQVTSYDYLEKNEARIKRDLQNAYSTLEVVQAGWSIFMITDEKNERVGRKFVAKNRTAAERILSDLVRAQTEHAVKDSLMNALKATKFLPADDTSSPDFIMKEKAIIKNIVDERKMRKENEYSYATDIRQEMLNENPDLAAILDRKKSK